MRYAYGVLLGALLTGIIFVGTALIKMAGFGADQATLQALWGLFVIWTFVSVVIIVVPLVVVYFVKRDIFREFLVYELGGLALFTPPWFVFATDISGDPWVEVLLTGIQAGLPAPGSGGEIVGMGVSPIILIPSFILMIVVGLFMLRPSFIQKFSTSASVSKKPEKEKPTPTESVESEMPEVAPPVADDTSISELRAMLASLSVQEANINAIIDAGIATVTDLVATSAEQIAKLTGMDKRSAEDLHMAVQKKVWFGGI